MNLEPLNSLSQITYINELPAQAPFFVYSRLFNGDWQVQLITRLSDDSKSFYISSLTPSQLRDLFLKYWSSGAKGNPSWEKTCIDGVVEAFQTGGLIVSNYKPGSVRCDLAIQSTEAHLSNLLIPLKLLDSTRDSDQLDLFDVLLELSTADHRNRMTIKGMQNASIQLADYKKKLERTERRLNDAEHLLQQANKGEKPRPPTPSKKRGPTNLAAHSGPIRKVAKKEFEEDSDED